jgi:hypothetical protein
LNLVCLEDVFSCTGYVNEDWRTIDVSSISGIFNEELCRLEVSFNTLGTFDTNSWEYDYLGFGGIAYSATYGVA